MDGIELEGIDEIQSLIQDMTIDDNDAIKAVRAAIKPIASKIEKNTPIKKGKLKKISKTVKKVGLAVEGNVKTRVFYDMFQEFGTSYQKHNVGYFERAVQQSENEALQILSQELFNKIK